MLIPQPPPVRIVEVGPRDGLQNISKWVPTATKLDLIRRLERCGLRSIELTSIVSHRAVPQMSDSGKLLSEPDIQSMFTDSNLQLPVLVPNLRGLETAVQKGVQEIAVFISATEHFSRANINCSCAEGIERAEQVAIRAKELGLSVRGYVSCIFEDPYDGPTQPSAVLHGVRKLFEMGCYEVSLGDTLGVGSPASVRVLLRYLKSNGVPMSKLAGHFHDTYNQAQANVWEAYCYGVKTFDGSVAGIGGCPFLPGAKGNVSTESLITLFENAGVNTGVNMEELLKTSAWISNFLGEQ